MSVSAYAPEMLELFKQARLKEIRMVLPTLKAAQRMRYRLHNLRRALRDESHPMQTIANGVVLSIEETAEGRGLLIAHPADDEFVGALRAAGVTVNGAESHAAPESEISSAVASPEVDTSIDILKDLLDD